MKRVDFEQFSPVRHNRPDNGNAISDEERARRIAAGNCPDCGERCESWDEEHKPCGTEVPSAGGQW